MDAASSADDGPTAGAVVRSTRRTRSNRSLLFLAACGFVATAGDVWIMSLHPLTWNAWPLVFLGVLPWIGVWLIWLVRDLVVEASGEGIRRLTPAARSWTWRELSALVPVGEDGLVLVLGPARRRQLRVDPAVRPRILALARAAGVAAPEPDAGGSVRSEVTPSLGQWVLGAAVGMGGGLVVFVALSLALQAAPSKGPSPVNGAAQGLMLGLLLAFTSTPRHTTVVASEVGIASEQRVFNQAPHIGFESWESLSAIKVHMRGGRVSVRLVKKTGRATPFSLDPAVLPAFEELARAHGVPVEKDAKK